jgi:pyruvate,water dikinase
MKLCVLACENSSKIKLLEGAAAQKFIKNIEVEKIDYNVKELKGQTACIGKVKGRVKIINTPDDMMKMKEGDILVSFATNPNLMPAIRKASAIITDEGGLTCHAAIVSRELNIPCVVGLKIITQVLKDGDLVEVNANKGIVKII